MLTDYRIVKDDNTYQVCLVEFDSDQNPIKQHSLNMSGDSIEELNRLLVYSLSSLTKPVIDIAELDNDKKHNNAINTALDLLRNKHD
jgi:hypothetical protein